MISVFSYGQHKSIHKVQKGESIYIIAKKYQVSDSDIYELNPSIKGKPLQLNTELLIPFRKDNNGTIIVETHTISSGETLNIIAEKYHMSLATLSKLNPTVDSRRLKIGTVLKLTESLTLDPNSNESLTTTNSDNTQTHVVVSGESLGLIANKYNLSLAELTKLNPTVDARRLQIGTVLKISENSKTENINTNAIPQEKSISNKTAQKTHTIAKGETLSIVANKYNISLDELSKLNPTADPKKLFVGATLIISETVSTDENNEEIILKEETLAPEKPLQKTHIISSGETLKSIADKYNMSLNEISKLNPKADSRRLKVGTKLQVTTTSTEAINVIEKTTVEKNEIPFELKTHKIKSGETLKTIAKKYKIEVKELTKLNPKLEPRNLKIGTVVKLNKPSPLMTSINKNESLIKANLTYEEEDVLHKVQSNETKYGIAKKYGITVQQLDELNPEVSDKLFIDYMLVIKRGTKSTEELKPETIEGNKKAETNAMIAEILIENASKYMGVSYRSGGTSAKGFDCSGLMFTTFKEIDLDLPRSSRSMAKVGTVVSKNKAEKGDLIFFTTNRKGSISHVGIVSEINGDEIKFIHSSTSSGVMVSSLKESYYSKRFVQINRVLK